MVSFEDNQNECPEEQVTFAGFSESEWVHARSLLIGPEEAVDEVGRLFARLRVNASNGFSVAPANWALLSLVNESCARRVGDAIESYPSEFKSEVTELSEAYGRMIQAGTLRPAFAEAREKFLESQREIETESP